MRYTKHIWDQLLKCTKKEIANALKKSDFPFVARSGAIHAYRHKDGRRVTIHYHPKETFKKFPDVLEHIIDIVDWTIQDLKKLKLIKKKG